MKYCDRCKRQEAVDSQYWYAMGRLHERDQTKPITPEELQQVMDDRYCWLHVTAQYDGPYGPEYNYGFEDCSKRKA